MSAGDWRTELAALQSEAFDRGFTEGMDAGGSAALVGMALIGAVSFVLGVLAAVWVL
jgi:hypothetical protein